MEPICKCPSCVHSEALKKDFNLPYRYIPSAGQKVFHLIEHFLTPVIGAFLIGASWWALIPFAGFLVTYVVNSFLFCPGCPYHHERPGLCGCFPRSVFPYKKNKPWGHAENIIGWPLMIILMICPTLVTLHLQGKVKAMFFFLAYFTIVLVIHGIVSCPECRQRGVCYQGRTVVFLKKR
ncbi:MAG: hypothetical protein GY737_17900 [Desulfobacteraceae bacterium]|nr:hypothetical protein [Desulfobacteraceae bacterium]